MRRFSALRVGEVVARPQKGARSDLRVERPQQLEQPLSRPQLLLRHRVGAEVHKSIAEVPALFQRRQEVLQIDAPSEGGPGLRQLEEMLVRPGGGGGSRL